MDELISVIISTYNSPKWLEKVLTSYLIQDDQNFEIVIADDGSRDETRALIESFASTAPFACHHVWHEDNGFQKWAIMNKAVDQSNGSYIIITDGDCVAPAHFVSTHRKFARQDQYLSGGYYRLSLPTSQALSLDHIQSGQFYHPKFLATLGQKRSIKTLKISAHRLGMDTLLNAVIPTPPTFNGNNASVFKSDFLTVNGFDTRIGYGGGDREFGYRLVHAGLTPKRIRYSNCALHLDHPRGYKDQDIIHANNVIIAQTQTSKRIKTEFGLS